MDGVVYFLLCFIWGIAIGTIGNHLGVPTLVQLLIALPGAFLIRSTFFTKKDL